MGSEGRRLDGADELVNKSVEATLGVHPGTGVGAEMLSLNLWGVSGRGEEVILLAFRGGRRDLRSAVARDEGRDGGEERRGGGLDMRRDDGGDSAGRTFW